MSTNDFEELLEVADGYAQAVAAFHQALGAARLTHLAAATSLEQRYAFLSMACIPEKVVAHVGVTTPSFAIAELQEHGNGNDSDEAADDQEDEEEKENEEDTDQDDDLPRSKRMLAAGEPRLWRTDPATWFCASPPHDLTECQAAFRLALERAIDVARSQRVSLAALSNR
jgi:hypothetical protein